MRFVFILTFFLFLILDSFSSVVKHTASLCISNDTFGEKIIALKEICKFIYQINSELIPVIFCKTGSEIKCDTYIIGVNGNALNSSIKCTLHPFHDFPEDPEWCYALGTTQYLSGFLN